MSAEPDVYDISDTELLTNIIKELIAANEIKALRKLLKNNSNCIQFKPKDLNKLFKINGYKFTKRKDRLVLILDKHDSLDYKCVTVLNKIVMDISSK